MRNLKKRFTPCGWMCFYALCTMGIDQLIKAHIRKIAQGKVLFEVCGWVQIVHITNTGAAFSLQTGHPLRLAMGTLILLVGAGCLCRRMRFSRPVQCACGLILGGGLGNWIDRVLYHGVTDYIRLTLIRFPVFNWADMAITMGTVGMMLLLILGKLEWTE